MATGYSKFWTRVFDEPDLQMDAIFASSLFARDKKKQKKQKKKQKIKEGKLVRRKDYLAKSEQSHKEQIHHMKTGKHRAMALLSQQQRRR